MSPDRNDESLVVPDSGEAEAGRTVRPTLACPLPPCPTRRPAPHTSRCPGSRWGQQCWAWCQVWEGTAASACPCSWAQGQCPASEVTVPLGGTWGSEPDSSAHRRPDSFHSGAPNTMAPDPAPGLCRPHHHAIR